MTRIRNKQLLVDSDFDMNSQKVVNVADGVNPNDGVNKSQLDAVSAGLSWKDSTRVASATGGNVADLNDVSESDFDGNAQGVTLAEGDRVLLKNQTNQEENGVYVAGASGSGTSGSGFTTLTRVEDMDTAEEVEGAAVFVEEGTHADEGWTQTADNVTLDTDPLTFVKFTGLGQVTAGDGLDKTGDTIFAVADTVGGANLATVINITSNGIAVRVNDENVGEDSDQLSSAQPIGDAGQREQNALVTSSDGDQAVSNGLTFTPAKGNDGEVRVDVFINGVQVVVGDGVKTKDCYFSADGGTTAKAFSAIAQGDDLYWNGSVAGYELDTSDIVTYGYNTLDAAGL